jgi:hypothetical protein
MKTKKLARSLKEYNRLQSLIDDIERGLEKLAKINTHKDNISYVGGALTLSGFATGTFIRDGQQIYVDVVLPRPLSELIREDVIDSLKVQLGIAKRQQDALEV